MLRWQVWLGRGWRAERPAGGTGGKESVAHPLLPAGALLAQLLFMLRQGDPQTATLVTPGQKPSQPQQFEAHLDVFSL